MSENSYNIPLCDSVSPKRSLSFKNSCISHHILYKECDKVTIVQIRNVEINFNVFVLQFVETCTMNVCIDFLNSLPNINFSFPMYIIDIL